MEASLCIVVRRVGEQFAGTTTLDVPIMEASLFSSREGRRYITGTSLLLGSVVSSATQLMNANHMHLVNSLRVDYIYSLSIKS